MYADLALAIRSNCDDVSGLALLFLLIVLVWSGDYHDLRPSARLLVKVASFFIAIGFLARIALFLIGLTA